MANRKRGRKGRKYNSAFQVLPVNVSLALATLANNTALVTPMITIDDDFWVQSADLLWSIRTLSPGQVPIHVGIANGDLSVAEIKEALNALPVSRSDIVQREHARRPVRRVGVFGNGALTDDALENGTKIRTTIKMYLAEGTDVNMYAFNQSGASLTTGAIVQVTGVIYGSWR